MRDSSTTCDPFLVLRPVSVSGVRQYGPMGTSLSRLLARVQAGISENRAAFIPCYRLIIAAFAGRNVCSAALARNRIERRTMLRVKAMLDWADIDLPQPDGRASTAEFLLLLTMLVVQHRPRVVVEFGAGLSTLILARALQLHGGGRLISYEHKEGFAELARARLSALGLAATVHSVPLEPADRWQYPGSWYAPTALPSGIDLIVIDGPPAYFAAGTRGAASPVVFPRLSPGGVIVLDDAKRPGERENARRWIAEHSDIAFFDVATRKGALIGHNVAGSEATENILSTRRWDVTPVEQRHG